MNFIFCKLKKPQKTWISFFASLKNLKNINFIFWRVQFKDTSKTWISFFSAFIDCLIIKEVSRYISLWASVTKFSFEDQDSENPNKDHPAWASNIPWWGKPAKYSKFCRLTDIPSWANNETVVCYHMRPLQPVDPAWNPDTENHWYVRETDAENPIYYSTCYRRQTIRAFTGK